MNNREVKKRIISDVKKLLIILGVGIAYYFVVLISGKVIPCIFFKITGLLCPGCGITRMLSACLRLDFLEAYGYNKILFVTLPILLAVFALQEARYIKSGKRSLPKSMNILLWAEIAILLIFGAVRNII